MRRLIAWAVAAVVTAVTVPVGLLVLLMMVLLIVQPTIVSEADRADALTWVLVEEGPPIRGSFDLDGKVIYLVLASDRHYPRWFIHGMGKAACQDAGLLAWRAARMDDRGAGRGRPGAHVLTHDHQRGRDAVWPNAEIAGATAG